MSSTITNSNRYAATLHAIIALVLLVLYSTGTLAGTQVLGVEIGVSTVESVTEQMSKITKVYPTASSQWKNAPMLRASGEGFEIEGLRTVTFVFDLAGRLAGVILTMDKSRYGSVVDLLARKYQRSLRQDETDESLTIFFNAGGTTVEVGARQKEKYFSVAYMSNETLSELERQQNIERLERSESESKKF